MQKVGEYQMKRPKFILFLDKDGTTNLEDKNLNNIFHQVSTMGGMVIFVTGRTIVDIESELKEKKIVLPEILVGDNGAIICYTKTNEFIKQKEIEHDKILEMIEYFIKNGGNKDYIRFANGRELFVSDSKEVRSYYRKNKEVKFCEDICEIIKSTKNITKLVLAGSKEKMEDFSAYVEKMDCWTEMDVTRFPKKEAQNYRLDIAQKNISKGDSVKFLVEILEPEYGYICVGNGLNDVSMFKVAIEDNMRVAIMANSPDGLLEQMQQYAKEKKKGKVEKVPQDKNLANRYIMRKAKCFQASMREKEKKNKKCNRLPNVPRIKVEELKTRNISRGTGWQVKNRDR